MNTMSKRVVTVGIAGQGRSGYDIHARWLRTVPEQFKIVAVADELPERRQEAREQLGARVFSTWQELIQAGGFELFVNALPSPLHGKGALAALKAGYHVVCEKPFAQSAAEVDRMAAAAKKARRMLAPFQNSRFQPFFQKIVEIINSGALGKIVFIRSNWGGFGRRWDWQCFQCNQGGSLWNTGPHPLDHAIILFGTRETPRVFCRMACNNAFGGDANDFCNVILYGRRSPTIEILLSSYQAYPQGEMYHVSGTFGGLAGGPRGIQWKYFDPAKAPVQSLWHKWSDRRKYCGETLPWVEENWTPPEDLMKDDFQYNSRMFYNNIHDVLTRNGALSVTVEQVRRQIAVMAECHRQNRLPRKRQSW
jgi:predicted dehydrogenase